MHSTNVSSFRDGSFAVYAEVKDGLFTHVPKGMSMEEAATLGVGCTTVGQGVYQTRIPVLIYGGSAATGTLAIQFAKLSGLTVTATASKRHHAILKEFGADAGFD